MDQVTSTSTSTTSPTILASTFHVGSHQFDNLADATRTARHHVIRTGVVVAITERRTVNLASPDCDLAMLCHLEDAVDAIDTGLSLGEHQRCYKLGQPRESAATAYSIAHALVMQLGTIRKARAAVARAMESHR